MLKNKKLLFYSILAIGFLVVVSGLVLCVESSWSFAQKIESAVSAAERSVGSAVLFVGEKMETGLSSISSALTDKAKAGVQAAKEGVQKTVSYSRKSASTVKKFVVALLGGEEAAEVVPEVIEVPTSSEEGVEGDKNIKTQEYKNTETEEVGQIPEAAKLSLEGLASIDLSKNYSLYTYTLSDYECASFEKTALSDKFSVSCENAAKKWKHYYVKEIDTEGLESVSVQVTVGIKELVSGRDNEYHDNVDFAILETSPHQILSRECNKVGDDWSKCSIDSIKDTALKSCSISEWTTGTDCNFDVISISADRIYLVFSVIDDSDETNIKGMLSDLRMSGSTAVK